MPSRSHLCPLHSGTVVLTPHHPSRLTCFRAPCAHVSPPLSDPKMGSLVLPSLRNLHPLWSRGTLLSSVTLLLPCPAPGMRSQSYYKPCLRKPQSSAQVSLQPPATHTPPACPRPLLVVSAPAQHLECVASLITNPVFGNLKVLLKSLFTHQPPAHRQPAPGPCSWSQPPLLGTRFHASLGYPSVS